MQPPISADLPTQIEALLRQRLSATAVFVEDESYLHAGHAGAGAGGHYRVIVVSPEFADKPILQQHRLVYDALATEMAATIHALALKTYTPQQWQDEKWQKERDS
jgi:BolA protein